MGGWVVRYIMRYRSCHRILWPVSVSITIPRPKIPFEKKNLKKKKCFRVQSKYWLSTVQMETVNYIGWIRNTYIIYIVPIHASESRKTNRCFDVQIWCIYKRALSTNSVAICFIQHNEVQFIYRLFGKA